MVKFGGEIGTLYHIFTPCTPLPFEHCSKKLHFFEMGASLIYPLYIYPLYIHYSRHFYVHLIKLLQLKHSVVVFRELKITSSASYAKKIHLFQRIVRA